MKKKWRKKRFKSLSSPIYKIRYADSKGYPQKNIRINKCSPASSQNSMRLFIKVKFLNFFLYNTNIEDQRLACLFCKRPNSKHFGLFRVQGFFSNYSALSL